MSAMVVTVKGAKELAANLDAISKRALDMTPAMRVSAEEAFRLMEGTFRAQTSPDGSRWEPLAESTLRKRVRGKKTGNLKPLIGDTGQLKGTLFAEAMPNGVKLGDKATSKGGFPYWLSQLFGAHIRRVGKRAGAYSIDIPARPFMPVALVGGRVEVMTSGRAAKWYEKFVKRAMAYIKTGQVT